MHQRGPGLRVIAFISQAAAPQGRLLLRIFGIAGARIPKKLRRDSEVSNRSPNGRP
jgi:hypothetical protein